MAKELEVLFNPVKDNEVDEIEIKISSRFRHFLKRVKANDNLATVAVGSNNVERYLVKNFIKQNFSEFITLWSKDLLTGLSLKLSGTYSDYISLVKTFQGNGFSTLVAEIQNYKRHNFQCDIDNIEITITEDNDSNDNTDNTN